MKTILEIKRPNGKIEMVDVTDRWLYVEAKAKLAAITTATAKAGRGEVLGLHRIDDRTEGEQAYDAVGAAYAKAEAIKARGGVGSYFAAENATEKAEAAWAMKYPEAAEAMTAERAAWVEADHKAYQERVANSWVSRGLD